MPSKREIYTPEQKSALLLVVLCQIICFVVVALLLAWALSKI